MSEELAEIIREEIRRDGPIPFSRWMELCLYHPQYGYYMKPGRKTGHGRDADFVTPPTLHPFLGQAVGRELGAIWEECGAPSTFTVVEYGGGEGVLAKAALAWLDSSNPRLARSVRWCHVEANPQRLHSDDPRIHVIPVHDFIEDEAYAGMSLQDAGLPSVDVLVACELLDALPTEIFQCLESPEKAPPAGRWAALRVGLRNQEFIEDWEAVPSWRGLDEVTSARDVEPRDQIAAMDEAAKWLSGVTPGVRAAALLIDYGGLGPNGGPRGFRRHALVDPLTQPGETDITVSIDFPQFAKSFLLSTEEWAHRETITLERFLLRNGILDELNQADRHTVEGASAYLRLRQLLLPTGMGSAFKVQRFDRAMPPQRK